ncbi:MAG: GNAT family N-acetyltransferase [Alphaproteobacteria bacterium]|nr:GNAT family N-acetyltransferase [Alphaproteobacteria bacterium]
MITIKPIFNQSPESYIWRDFADVEFASVQGKRVGSPIRHLETMIQLYEYEYNNNALPFAFGAYNFNNKMVGFIKGHIVAPKDFAYVSSLYVTPDYQGNGIGEKLLRSAEKSASLYVGFVSLKSLPEAEGFYIQQGYECSGRRYNFYKGLTFPSNETVPAFGWHEILDNKTAYDITDKVKDKQNFPMLVHVNSEEKIDGVVVRDNKSVTLDHCSYKSSAMRTLIDRKLILALDLLGLER